MEEENPYKHPHNDTTLEVIPVDKHNLHIALEARKHISHESWWLYTSGDTTFNLITYTASKPPLNPNEQGHIFYIILLDDEVVSLSNHYYYKDPSGQPCVRGGLVILDKHQRQGIGTTYSHTSVQIARHMGAHTFHGQTRVESPMHKLRKRQGWKMGTTFKKRGTEYINISLTL